MPSACARSSKLLLSAVCASQPGLRYVCYLDRGSLDKFQRSSETGPQRHDAPIRYQQAPCEKDKLAAYDQARLVPLVCCPGNRLACACTTDVLHMVRQAMDLASHVVSVQLCGIQF